MEIASRIGDAHCRQYHAFDCTLDGDVKALSRTISVMSYDIMKLNLNTY